MIGIDPGLLNERLWKPMQFDDFHSRVLHGWAPQQTALAIDR
jgi:hypothetical protein